MPLDKVSFLLKAKAPPENTARIDDPDRRAFTGKPTTNLHLQLQPSCNGD